MKPFIPLLLCTALTVAGCKLWLFSRGGDDAENTFSSTTTYSDAWVTVSNDTPPPSGSPDNAGKIPVGTHEGGNREFLFADSIRQDKGVITALIEYRYAAPQVLPETGRSYTHNHWLEQIDCANGIRSIRATTHYNADNQIVDANEYAVPRYSAEDIKMLAKPDDPVIVEVCRRINGNAPPAEASAPASTPASGTKMADGQSDTAAPKPPENAASAPMPPAEASAVAEASAPAEAVKTKKAAESKSKRKDKKDKTPKGKKAEKENTPPVADSQASAPAAADDKKAAAPTVPPPAENGEIPLTPVSTAP